MPTDPAAIARSQVQCDCLDNWLTYPAGWPQVILRMRPVIAEDGDEPLAAVPEHNAVVLGDRGTFGPFDAVLDSSSTQDHCWEACGRQVCMPPHSLPQNTPLTLDTLELTTDIDSCAFTAPGEAIWSESCRESCRRGSGRGHGSGSSGSSSGTSDSSDNSSSGRGKGRGRGRDRSRGGDRGRGRRWETEMEVEREAEEGG